MATKVSLASFRRLVDTFFGPAGHPCHDVAALRDALHDAVEVVLRVEPALRPQVPTLEAGDEGVHQSRRLPVVVDDAPAEGLRGGGGGAFFENKEMWFLNPLPCLN